MMEPDNATSLLTADSSTFQPRPRAWIGILGVTIALSAPVVQILLFPWMQRTFAFPMDRFVSLWPFWIAVALALGLAHYVEGFPMATFGFRRSQKTLRARLIEWILMVVMAMVVAVVIIFFSQTVRGWITGDPTGGQQTIVLSFPYWVLIPAWVTAWFAEEVLFRSYPIERLIHLTGRPWLAGLIPALAFTVLHLFAWDWIHVLTVVLPASVLMTLIYLWKRSLVFVMVIHAVMAAPLLLLPLIAPYL
jgi:uncharacterized protein